MGKRSLQEMMTNEEVTKGESGEPMVSVMCHLEFISLARCTFDTCT